MPDENLSLTAWECQFLRENDRNRAHCVPMRRHNNVGTSLPYYEDLVDRLFGILLQALEGEILSERLASTEVV